MRTSISKVSYVESLNAAWSEHLKPRTANAPTVISTFAGCGGSSLGYSIAGFRELLAVEWDDNAAATFRLNFPDLPIYHGDIAALTVDEALKLTGLKPGELDVLDGSPPCQGFSTAGRRRVSDSRNQLFLEFARLLRGLRPKIFVMENVSGMIKGSMRIIFAEILRTLKESGYDVRVKLIDASFLGVPQKRQRLIFVGTRNDLNIAPSHPQRFLAPVISVHDAIGDLASEPEDRPMKDWLREKVHLLPTSGGSKRTKQFLRYVKGSTGSYIGLKKLNAARPCSTICKSEISVAGLVHYSRPRYLTMRELARLGSFPDQFRFIDRKSAVERIGNSVPPLMMAAIANHVRTILSDNSRL